MKNRNRAPILAFYITVRFLSSFLLLTALGSLHPCPVYAQDTPGATELRPKPDAQLRDFWRRERSSHILVALRPDDLRGKQGDDKPLPRNLLEWLEANGAASRSFGTITAIGERNTLLFSSRFGNPDFFNTGNPWKNKTNAQPQLLASLSAAQWRQIASPQGLGSEGLPSEQKVLWDLSVPNPFVIGSYVSTEGKLERSMRTLTDAERRQVRIRVKLISSVYTAMAQGSGSFPIIVDKNLSERAFVGEPYHYLKEDGAYGEPVVANQSGASWYGQLVAALQPAHPKTLPESIEKTLAAGVVSIPKPSGENPITAGELLTRIEAATGLRLHAGGEFRNSPLLVLNTGNVRADDLLQALLFAKDFTVRVLPPAQSGEPPFYVIASTTEPEGRILGRFSDWKRAATETEKGMMVEANARIREQNPVPLLRFDADDPMPLFGDLKERVFARARNRIKETWEVARMGVSIPFPALPPEAQKAINTRAKGLVERHPNDLEYHPRIDTVQVDCTPWIGYVVPSTGDFAGEIDVSPISSLAEWLPSINTKDTKDLRERIVLFAPSSVEEAQQLTEAAKQAEAKEIWIQASPDMVASAVSAAGAVPVRAVVSLVRATADAPETFPRDENIYGKKSREWLVPNDEQVMRWAADRVHRAASVPGVAGVVLRDIAPPGYRGSNTATEEQPVQTGDANMSYGGTGRAVGYTLANRRAYVEETNTDPADIFEEKNSDSKKWHTWRQQRLVPLWQNIREAAGKTSLLLEGEATFATMQHSYPAGMEIFVPWDAKEPEPPLSALFVNTAELTPRFDDKATTLAVILGNPQSPLTTAQLLGLLQRHDKPAATIWDLSNNSIPGVREQIRLLKRQAANP